MNNMGKDIFVLWDNLDYLILIPLTEQACCIWSENTEWTSLYQPKYRNPKAITNSCFYDFHQDGPIIICLNKKTHKKYRFHKRYRPVDENNQPLQNVKDHALLLLGMISCRLDILPSYHHIFYDCFKLSKLILSERHDIIEYVPVNTPGYLDLITIAIKEHAYLFESLYEKISKEDILYVINKSIELDNNFLAMAGLSNSFWSQNLIEYEHFFKLAIPYNPKHIYGLMAKEHLIEKHTYNTLIKYAVRHNPECLQYIPRDNKIYLELCELAIINKPEVISHLGRLKMETYQRLALIAIQKDWRAIVYVKNNLPEYKEICNQIVKDNLGITNKTYLQNRRLIGKEIERLDHKNREVQDIILNKYIENDKIKREGTPVWIRNKEYLTYKDIIQECWEKIYYI